MKMNTRVILWMLVHLIISLPVASAQNGEAHVPLAEYRQLLAATQEQPDVAPVAYGLSARHIDVVVQEYAENYRATVRVRFTARVYEDKWTTVPLLPLGVAVSKAQVNGRAVQLHPQDDVLAWLTQTKGEYRVELSYEVAAIASNTGFSLPIALAVGGASTFTAVIPLQQIEATLIPAVTSSIEQAHGYTTVRAHIPSQRHVLLTWSRPVHDPYVISRAWYQGERNGDALQFTAQYSVDVFRDAPLQVPLLPKTVTLHDVLVDGEQAIVLVKDDRFVTRVHGRGKHTVEVVFQVPIVQQEGPPSAELNIPLVPVSHFELTLPGKKEVFVTPVANVARVFAQDHTVAKVHLPMVQQVRFSWGEAIPEAIKNELRANASLYHTLHAEEGVLYGKAVIVYEITRGETSGLDLLLPASVQINRIEAPSGGVSDWRVGAEQQGRKHITVFLDRKITGEYIFHVYYEQLLDLQKPNQQAIDVPLLQATNVHRQRGMVALLSSTELTLQPVQAERISKVGENQLPAFVRQDLHMIVAHTYKYADSEPLLTVQGVAPERKRGKFDAKVDTLVSIGEVALKGAATVSIHVKSGSVMSLQLKLPENVSVLGLTAPSLRTYQVKPETGHQIVDIEFTQELEGQFRLDLSYEQILSEVGQNTHVPTISVVAAEVEHGRIAVEALAAVEVQATTVEQLSSVDVNELPQQLVLKTTNPILLAYRYVRIETPYRLALKVTRHKELDVQVATIEQASYRTLLTRDGLAVTTANFRIRNSRKQFLRLQLPEGSQVWSTFVEGKAEKPAQASDGAKSVLIKLMNSTRGFAMQVVYATHLAALQDSGVLQMQLPKPDMVVTHTDWDIFLPDDKIYFTTDSNMQVRVNGQLATAPRASTEPAGGQGAIQVSVPVQGMHFAFNKLYANQSGQQTYVAFRYVSQALQQLGMLLGVLGVLSIGAGLLWLLLRRKVLVTGVTVMVGVGLLGYAHGVALSSVLPSLIAAGIVFLLLLIVVYRRARG